MKTICLYLIVFVFSLSSCAHDPIEDAKMLVEAKIAKLSNNSLQVVGFRKINGIESVQNGVDVYDMEYKVEVKVIKDGVWGYVNDNKIHAQNNKATGLATIMVDTYHNEDNEGATLLKKGEVYHFSTDGSNYGIYNLTMIESDNGWIDANAK